MSVEVCAGRSKRIAASRSWNASGVGADHGAPEYLHASGPRRSSAVIWTKVREFRRRKLYAYYRLIYDGSKDVSSAWCDWALVAFSDAHALHWGHSKCCPGTCSSRSSKRFGSPSKRHSATRHCCESPSAAVKSSSGVILSLLLQSTIT
jgi:hypothetical protein